MKMKMSVSFVLALAMVAALVPAIAEAGSGQSTFVPVAPCRIYDTRDGANPDQPFAGGETRSLPIVGTVGPFLGGTVGGCGVPGQVGSVAQASAVAVNITAVDSTHNGNFKAWAGDETEPSASVINFRVNTPIANMLIVKLSQDGVDGDDLSLKASGSAANNVELILDVVGYFVEQP